jgi:signal transduction histidine kinase
VTGFSALFGERYSLRRNLVVNIILALFFCIALATVILVREFYEHLRENIEDALTQEAQELAEQIDPSAAGYGLNPQALRFRGSEGIYRYTVFDSELGVLLGGESTGDIITQLTALALGAARPISLADGRIGIAQRARVDQQDFYVLISTVPPGSDKTRMQTLINEIEEEFQWVLVGITAIFLATLLATRRALRPLNIISQQAHDVGPDAASRRLTTDHLPAEILPLVNAVNGAFDRLEQGYRAQRDFSSNVAHEVRTPLAVLRSSIEQIEDPDLKAGLKQDVGRLDQLFEQLIDLSRAEALGPAGFEAVNLRELAVTLAGDMAPQTVRDGKALAVIGAEQSRANGHPGLLSIALGNLVRNALTYSPKGSEIEIEILANPAGWKVYDRGPGVPDTQKQALFERFHRGVGLAKNTLGTGIGLAIVQSVADAHGAQVRIEDRPGGGSIFVFEFNG